MLPDLHTCLEFLGCMKWYIYVQDQRFFLYWHIHISEKCILTLQQNIFILIIIRWMLMCQSVFPIFSPSVLMLYLYILKLKNPDNVCLYSYFCWLFCSIILTYKYWSRFSFLVLVRFNWQKLYISCTTWYFDICIS